MLVSGLFEVLIVYRPPNRQRSQGPSLGGLYTMSSQVDKSSLWTLLYIDQARMKDQTVQ